ncbi:peptide MFS transporter [Pseudoxanthomonas indica]|uniref:Proton-dependent oligopeptide transporter, POT family n=1 Tax=Pseudoxanthomonas indica TaxID=428993 RepID=A0A1T5LC43_9GAMM|nr:peptide MFS transporter [Pseudoxanthomonas indica]GGD33352.1 MFS transporter [Pseudoxanthomonas indica]SKC73543.1 proton-dependent oligopeptide transporter, POT family [Pseudoxanthomonas indica]
MSSVQDKTWFGQPRGLTILFLTNMWELFSYYGMRALLVYYMTKQLMFAQEKASFIYGTYTAMAYFTPIVGGVIADRWLGKRRAVILGGSIMALGHFLMAFEPLFYLALATIALGNGLFLPSLPSQINDLYRADDPRRGRAYNVYYVGLNLGGFLAPLVCGTLGEVYGWHYGFGAAGIGMFVGLMIYVAGHKYLPQEAQRSAPVQPSEGPASSGRLWLLLLGVGIAATIFRGAYEQIGNTLPLWIDSGVDRSLGSFVIPMTWFQSLNPLLVISMTPFLLWFWRLRAGQGKETRPAIKMAIGALIVAAAYLMLAVVTATLGDQRATWPWLLAFFIVLTFGELYILPTGLGLFARLAPARLGATTVASWFLAIFSGSLLAGAVGTLWSSASHAGFFVLLAALAVVAAGLLWLLDKPIRQRI